VKRLRAWVLGNDPYMVTGGKVYLTGPPSRLRAINHLGAPFGLSIVTPDD
jgi:hypothetical protein